MLSDAARSVWAKSTDSDGGWLPLWQHADDAADVAGALIDNWLPSNALRLFSAEFDGDQEVSRTVLRFLAGIHDLGKATPAFAVQAKDDLAQRMREQGLYMPQKRELVDRHLAHHSVAGHHLLVRWLEAQGWANPAARTWGIVVGGHHGVPPSADTVSSSRPAEVPELYGAGSWERVRCEILEHVSARTGFVSALDRVRDAAFSAPFQVLATALVIVSDWIASNEELLPYHRSTLPEPADTPRRVQRALARLRLPKPWRPQPVPEDANQLFAARFELPPGARPRPVQEAVVSIARSMTEPGFMVVEAPMGEGKTEAALAAAEVMAQRWGAGGVLVALPTQATTDAMFRRVLGWLDAMGSSEQQVSGTIVLGHGKARFNRLYQGLFHSGQPRDVGADEPCEDGKHAVAAHAWLTGRKKALLANFAVVTIDQLLFAGLKARHLMLRHLALAGKVVVIDEVHAYDAYMNSYLTKVLTWLGSYGVPVLALSATLPSGQRRALLAAYQRGRTGGDAEPSERVAEDTGYPALTWTSGVTAQRRVVSASGRATSVRVEPLADDLDTLADTLRDALAGGGTALVVRNTVRRVLEAAHRLEQEFRGEITVAHARFIVADRLRKDTELLDAFGPPARGAARPFRHVVVASQVVEQSLDVDFDLVVTDLAPIDLVLQRMGRLHRHQRERPHNVRGARVHVTGADFEMSPPALDPAAERHVYGAYPLLRAAAVLSERFGGTIELPSDIAPLVQRAYGADEIGPDDWRDAMAEARTKWSNTIAQREDKARDFQIANPGKPGKAIVDWLRASVGETDDEAAGQGQVRDGAPSLEVLLVCEDEKGRWHTPAWLERHGGRPIPQTETPPDELGEVMASCLLRLPLRFSNEDAEKELWAGTPPAWEESRLIYRQPVLVVDEHGWGRIDGHPVRYTPERGLEVLDDAG